MDTPVLANQQKLAFICFVRRLDAVKRICQEQLSIGTVGEREREREKGKYAVGTPG